MWRWLKFAVLSLAAWPLFAWGVARALIVDAELARADVIVVLGGSATYTERAERAAQLYGEGRAAKVVLADDGGRGGWSNAQQRNPFFVERATEELRRLGVPAERIEVLPRVVRGTYDEAVLLREYAMARDLRSILVVTSAYHSRRALWTLRRVLRESGVKEVGLSSVPAGQQTPSPVVWWLNPRGWRMVAAEYPKLAYYLVSY